MTGREKALKNFDYYAPEIPHHIVDAFRLYLDEGIEPGSFCMAVLCNDLKEAAARADHINRERLADIAHFMVWAMPRVSQGSAEKVQMWMEKGGLKGLEKL